MYLDCCYMILTATISEMMGEKNVDAHKDEILKELLIVNSLDYEKYNWFILHALESIFIVGDWTKEKIQNRLQIVRFYKGWNNQNY